MTLTTDRQTFLRAIQAAPGDPVPRLVLADYLDEQGDPDGELIRLVCEVQASGYQDGPAWRRLATLADADDGYHVWCRLLTDDQRYRLMSDYDESGQWDEPWDTWDDQTLNEVDRWIACRAVEYRLGFHSTEGET